MLGFLHTSGRMLLTDAGARRLFWLPVLRFSMICVRVGALNKAIPTYYKNGRYTRCIRQLVYSFFIAYNN